MCLYRLRLDWVIALLHNVVTIECQQRYIIPKCMDLPTVEITLISAIIIVVIIHVSYKAVESGALLPLLLIETPVMFKGRVLRHAYLLGQCMECLLTHSLVPV